MSGACQTATITPRINVAVSGLCRACSRGSAKPRHPGSSPMGANTGTTMCSANAKNNAGSSSWANAESEAPIATFAPPAAKATPTGTRIAAAYQGHPTRHCTMR